MENEKKTTKKRATVRPMIITPLVFVLIALIAAVPASLKAYSFAKDKLHKAREIMHIELSDLQPNDDYFKKCKKDGVEMQRDELAFGYKIGTIECNNAAVGCDVYYGINRISKRDGVGVSSNGGLFGEDKQIHIDGDSLTSFKALDKVKKGDVFTVQTPTGEYQYVVTDLLVAAEYTGNIKGEYLLLTTDASHEAFSHQNKDKLMVVATPGTGEVN